MKVRKPAPPPFKGKAIMETAGLSTVSVRAGITNELAQKALDRVKSIPKSGAWAVQVKIDDDNYVVGQPKKRSIVLVLPVPFTGEPVGYRVIKPFTSIEQFKEILEQD